MAAAEGGTASDLALAWQLSRPGMTAAIVGIRSVEEARALACAGSWGPAPPDLIDRVGEAVARFEETASGG
jgi:aryl-alcohol dehydrogenase-like predicted oxidoreductase